MTTPPEVLAAMVARLRERSEDQLLRESTVEEHLCAALAAAEALGWRLVPVEADEAMWDAGRYQIVAGEGALDIWNAMLNAAPKVSP